MRNWIDIILESQNDPSAIVKELRERYISETGKTPQQINSGLCFDFSDDLETEAPDLFMSVGVGNFMNHDHNAGECSDDATGWDMELIRLHYPNWQPAEGWTWEEMFEVLNEGCHGWAICKQNGLNYDVEAPEGVASPFDLPWFKNFLSKQRK